MAGFVSSGRSWGGAVVVRVSRSGWVWVFRSAPAAVCVPFESSVLASMWARSVTALGWRVWVHRGRRCGSAWECKVALPAGLSAGGARAVLPPVPRLSSLAELGVC
jgi:hypothetical protein